MPQLLTSIYSEKHISHMEVSNKFLNKWSILYEKESKFQKGYQTNIEKKLILYTQHILHVISTNNSKRLQILTEITSTLIF